MRSEPIKRINLEETPVNAAHEHTGNRSLRVALWLAATLGTSAGFALVAPGALPDSPMPAVPKLESIRPAIQSECKTPQPSSGVTAPLHVKGTYIYTPDSKEFIPYGMSVFGGNEQTHPLRVQYRLADRAQIIAARKYWYSNTIRLQVAQYNLFSHIPKGDTYNPRFLRYVQSEANLAKKLGMRTIINDQTEDTQSHANNPTRKTPVFWQVMSNQFRCQGNVIFDIFNEPRAQHETNTATAASSRWIWNEWENGGMARTNKYIGMQQVVDVIRKKEKAKNLIIAETPYNDVGFEPKEFASHTLKGKDIVYSFHHVNLNQLRKWGKTIVREAKKYPLIDGELSQFSSTRPECYSSAYRNLPLLLKLLSKEHIGVIGWSLQYDSMVKSTDNRLVNDVYKGSEPERASELSQPTTMDENYTCSTQTGEGGGAIFMRDFKDNSVLYPVTAH